MYIFLIYDLLSTIFYETILLSSISQKILNTIKWPNILHVIYSSHIDQEYQFSLKLEVVPLQISIFCDLTRNNQSLNKQNLHMYYLWTESYILIHDIHSFIQQDIQQVTSLLSFLSFWNGVVTLLVVLCNVLALLERR